MRTLKHKLAPALLALLLSFSGNIALPREASAQNSTSIVFPPELIQSWKAYMKNYPAALAQYKKAQEEIRRAAKPVAASAEKDADDLIKEYPFLEKDLREAKNVQKTIAESLINKPDPGLKQSIDTTLHLQIAEDKDSKTGINLFFLANSGRLWCGPHGCNMDVYADTGKGYQKAGEFIVARALYISRIGKNVFLFAGPPGDARTVAWVLKNNRFTLIRPPSPEPPTQAFLEWKTQLQQAGKWPPSQ